MGASSIEDDLPLTAIEWETRAAAALPSATFDYVAGGAGDELTITENRAAFERMRLVPRVMRARTRVTTETTLLGQPVAAPVMVAPFAYQGALDEEGEVATARAAAALGVTMCLSTLSNRSMTDVAEACGDGPRWFQLYPLADMAANHALVDEAASLGYQAVIVTVDLPPYGFREREIRNPFILPEGLDLPVVPPPPGGHGRPTPRETTGLMKWDLDWSDIGAIAAATDLPVIVKGILSPADAVLAADHGARAVIVSNHGGRQLDTTVAAIDALPAVAAVARERFEVYMDGGVRRGVDVLKALALGAHAVLVGRPVAWGLSVAGEAGVHRVLGQLVAETANALQLAGYQEPARVGPEVLFRPIER